MNSNFLESLNLKQLDAMIAQKSLIDFTTQTKPDFVTGWFNILIAKELQQFYQDVIDGKQPRLMIFAPPRSGKSELFSRRFPAWAFGKNPDLQMIACSYSADLASRMNRDVQRIMDDGSYHNIFPDSSLNEKELQQYRDNRYGIVRFLKLQDIKALIAPLVLVAVLQGWGRI